MSVRTLVTLNTASLKNVLFNQCNRPFALALLKVHLSSQSSVDLATVTHHSKLAVNWWDESGSMKGLHSMNSLRVPLVRDGLFQTGAADPDKKNTSRPLNGLQIIDVGCGGGLLSEPLARLGASVTGIDASLDLIEVAQNHAKLDPSLDGRLNYIHTAAETHVNEASEKYDAVVSSEVIEHVHDKNFFLEQCVRLLKPKGSIFLTTVNRTTVSWLGGIVIAENVLNAVPKGTHQWELFIRPVELQGLLEKYGCTTKLIHGMCYNPFANNWKWTQNDKISYAIHAVKAESN